MGNKPSAQSHSYQTSGSDARSCDAFVTETRKPELNGGLASSSSCEPVPVQTASVVVRPRPESEPTNLNVTVSTHQQLLIDQITNSLFGNSLLEAIDAVISLNNRKKERIPLQDSDENAGLETSDQSMPNAASEIKMGSSSINQQDLLGFVPNVPDRTDALIRKAVQFMWDARSSASDGSREDHLLCAALSPPEEFRSDWLDPDDSEPNSQAQLGLRYISRTLLFDLVAEAVGKIYAGEDKEFRDVSSDPGHRPRVTSSQFRLWNGPIRPQTFGDLLNLVRKQVQYNMELRASWLATENYSNPVGSSALLPQLSSNPIKFSKTVQWTLSKKPYLNALLELEMRAEESSWFSYTADEIRLKSNLADQLWNYLLNDALESMLRCSHVPNSTPLQL